MIEYAVACLPLVFFYIYISRNDTELTHRNTFLIKEKERYSAIIMQSSMFFSIMFVIIFSKISFGKLYINDVASFIISLFIVAGLFLKAFTNRVKSGSCLTAISLTKIKIMDKGMEEVEDEEEDEVEEEVHVNEDGEEVVTEKHKLLKKKDEDKKKNDDLTEKEKDEMEKYLSSSPDQDILELIQARYLSKMSLPRILSLFNGFHCLLFIIHFQHLLCPYHFCYFNLYHFNESK